MQIRPYITFHGECQQAIELYSKAFRAESVKTLRFSELPKHPGGPEIPSHQLEWVVQATLPMGDNFIRLSDTIGELNDAPSERVAIAVECEEELVRHAFAVLEEDGEVGIPLQRTFFSPCHGVVFDKFGVMWNFVAQDGGH